MIKDLFLDDAVFLLGLISFVLKQKKQKFKSWSSPLKINPVL